MSRIEFDGKGDPIPALALPAVGSDDNVAPTVLTFTDDAIFPVSDYRTLGFTHYEVMVVGAAGGRGGDAAAQQLIYVTEEKTKPLPQYLWDLVLESAALQDYIDQSVMYNFYRDEWLKYTTHVPGYCSEIYNRWWAADATPPVMNKVYYPGDGQDSARHTDIVNSYIVGGTPLPSGWSGTAAQARELTNPNHLSGYTTLKEILLLSGMDGLGGAGGGGGFLKTAGALADLPDTVPIVVGKAGADSPYGQVRVNGVFSPDLPALAAIHADFYNHYSLDSQFLSADQRRIYEISNIIMDYTTDYPLPHSSFINPVKGQDGGASSFAGAVAQASGGVGGEPGMVWDAPTNKFKIKGHGGAGGLGGRSAAGGGAAGSVAEGVNGADGTWLPETGIGEGGGGGKGGSPPTQAPGGGNIWGYNIPLIRHDATAGGYGSFSYADTSVYGQRQFRQGWSYLKLVSSWVNGSWAYTQVPAVDQNNLVTPGGGGGARPLPNTKVGSRAVGYSPNGVVIVRLMTITE